MPPTDDSVLLRQYAENQSDEAFAALVTRHINLVYSVAVRCVGDPHLAEEVAQAVFILLAKKAAQLRHDKALSSWLFQTTRLTASNFVRGETRRHRREQEAHMQSVLNDSGGDVWPKIAPLLDDAVAGLNKKDRDAIVLRFYEGRSLREVGAALGASEDAAEKRVSRAVERLREFLTKRGVTVGASGLVVVISANAVQAAPVGLAVTISTAAASAGATLVTTTTAAVTKAIVMTTLQKTLVASVLAVAVGIGIYKARQAPNSPSQAETLGPPDATASGGVPAPANEMITTGSGLRYQVLKRGAGTVSPKATDTVSVHYHGTLLDGTVFDSSVDRGRPFSFPLDTVIAGWIEGIQLMKVGDTFKFEIPPNLGYDGARMRRSKIPANSTLVFEIELLGIQ